MRHGADWGWKSYMCSSRMILMVQSLLLGANDLQGAVDSKHRLVGKLVWKTYVHSRQA